MQWPVFHYIMESLVYEVAFAFMAEIWPPMEFSTSAFHGTLYMVASITSVAQDHVLVAGFTPTERTRASIHRLPCEPRRRLLEYGVHKMLVHSTFGMQA